MLIRNTETNLVIFTNYWHIVTKISLMKNTSEKWRSPWSIQCISSSFDKDLPFNSLPKSDSTHFHTNNLNQTKWHLILNQTRGFSYVMQSADNRYLTIKLTCLQYCLINHLIIASGLSVIHRHVPQSSVSVCVQLCVRMCVCTSVFFVILL